MGDARQIVRVEGKRLKVSNLDKVLYPSTGMTKRDIMAYYSQVAPVMLPHCRDRAVTRKRWPNGVGDDGSGQMFFQKDAGDGVPDWVELRSIEHSDHVNQYPLANDLPTLTWLAQLAALELHVPQWRFGYGDEQLNPDRLVLDLDPGEGRDVRDCAQVAKLAREILTDIGLDPVPVTSGSKGVHIYAALDGSLTSDQVSGVAKELARSLEADYPDEVISKMKRSERAGKVFIDWSQNNASKTTIAPYSLRGRVHPMVAAPRTWRELASPHLKHLDYQEVLERVQSRGDPMAELEEQASNVQSRRDRLTVYREMRDQSKTPEPVPERVNLRDARSSGHDGSGGESDSGGDEPVFVIQRHDASRLHYDFRLEHDGVLVSWALPKGPPTDPKKNRLAVPTEDHPMEYRFFEGTIPKGQYGAGTVEIWDSGTVEIETWEADKVVATLSGKRGGGLGGSRKFSLFKTQDDPKPMWMIHLMEEERAGTGREKQPGKDKERDEQRDKQSRGRSERRSAEPYRPMLATRGTEAQLRSLDEDEWSFEMKWDGMRAIAMLDGNRVQLRSRSGADVSARYPELKEIAATVVADSAVLDGEIVALDDTGVPSFSRLQQRMKLESKRDIERVRQQVPVAYVLFDVLEVNKEDVTSLPYSDRRELLEGLIESDTSRVSVPPVFTGDREAAITASLTYGLEGVMAKHVTSEYDPGARSDEWLKFPHINTAEVVVIGWRPSTTDAGSMASLLVGLPGRDGLEYAGRVGTGFSNADRHEIPRRLASSERKTSPVDAPDEVRRDARWVTPKLVGELRFRERTANGTFRQPAWRGFRPDKTIEDLTPLT